MRATEEQVWALHDALEPRYRAGLLLAAYAGLRLAEVCGLRRQDVDLMRGVIHPTVQYPDDELKTKISRTPIPIPPELVSELSQQVDLSSDWVMRDELGHPMGPGPYNGHSGAPGAPRACQSSLEVHRSRRLEHSGPRPKT